MSPAAGPLDTAGFIFLLEFVTAVGGLFVAYQAHRGYRRNGSRPMLYLAAGVLLLTAVPFAVSYALETLTLASDALLVLAVGTLDVLGLSAVLYSLTRA